MYIKVNVVPNYNKDLIKKESQDRYKVYLRAKPERSEANKALCNLLNGYFDNPKGGVKIISGQHSTSKLLKIGN